MMISKQVLDSAKAFLCWDIFDNLTVQLIEIHGPSAYFLPCGSGQDTIVVFYRAGNPDFSKPLFYLFHEAGHCLQFDEWSKSGRADDFWKMINTPTGAIKKQFENESWQWSRDLFKDFIKKQNLPEDLLDEFDSFATECIATYHP